jgi:hypothetical protein
MPAESEHKGGAPAVVSHPAYLAARELSEWVRELEDKFPPDEIAVLYRKLESAAIDLGARLAEGIDRDGVDAQRRLSEATRRDARGKLSEVRHYLEVAAGRFLVDESQMGSFEEHEGKIRPWLV